MDENAFWELIEKISWRAGDEEEAVEPVVEALAKLPVESIYRFEDIMAEKLHALDGEAFAREIGEYAYQGPDEHFSVDLFLYARCMAVAKGRAFYEGVLRDPSGMPKDEELEALLSIAAEAYELKTDGDEFTHDAATDYETYSNAKGWPPRRRIGF